MFYTSGTLKGRNKGEGVLPEVAKSRDIHSVAQELGRPSFPIWLHRISEAKGRLLRVSVGEIAVGVLGYLASKVLGN